ncbi:hypothetical protein [Ammoniphilus resinae]|uniref:Flp pilus assembly pilin Flp n=1 Tax=Ammoniphilus resinae TaxID=861532 RepID=A0ABS4GKB6_9BACL|nr:hypothetical protein [Ammoniphilus resinae]MBP1930696.1 Flp pilus assembly pilin Flp [Ammoniphilus resinae]
MNKFWKVYGYVRNERGAQAIEYVAVAALVVALLGTIISLVGQDQSIAQTVISKLQNFVSRW